MRMLSSLSIRPLVPCTAVVLLALPPVAVAQANTGSRDPQTRTADCSTQEPRQGKSRKADSGCLAPPCSAPVKAPSQPGPLQTSRRIPVPGCQLALQDVRETPQRSG